MTLDDFNRLFESFMRSAFRVEARDRYDVPAERDELAAFRAGKTLDRRAPDGDAWLALVACATASGRTLERVRLVTRPLTQYTRYEFACYPDNIAAGETIGIVDRRWLQPDDERWAGQDFWIFDDEIVVVLDYDEQGRFLRVAQAEQIDPYLTAKQRAISLSVDFNRYLGDGLLVLGGIRAIVSSLSGSPLCPRGLCASTAIPWCLEAPRGASLLKWGWISNWLTAGTGPVSAMIHSVVALDDQQQRAKHDAMLRDGSARPLADVRETDSDELLKERLR